jgi:glucan phosphoethanolaminetransferase (alkaline phosphatase superfamily)
MEHPVLDDEVVVVLSDFVQRIGKGPKAAILHLYGQHFNYHDRYPDKYFKEEPPNMSSENLEGLRYARSAEYGLKVLLDVADILDQQTEPAFLVFTSDHGENLPMDHTGKRYHAGPVSGLNDTMVPVLILWNRAFADSGRQRLLKKLIDQPMIAHQDVAKTWLVLAGLPGNVEPSIRPTTWGSLEAGVRNAPLDCRALRP